MKERNFLPWAMAIQPLAAIHELLESYAGILGKLKMHESPENTKASKGPRSVPDCYKAWVTKLIKPYFAENGFNNKENDTEEQRELRDKMKEFACEDLKYEECLNNYQGHEAAAGRLAEDAAGYKDVAKCYKSYQRYFCKLNWVWFYSTKYFLVMNTKYLLHAKS